MKPETFIPTRAEALARIAAVRPDDYARSRNALDGAVTRLSPYITHGLVTLPEVLAGVAGRHALHVQHKFVFELGWREFFHHLWAHRGDAILHSHRDGPLPDEAYDRELPADIRHAASGVPAVDQAVHHLYRYGWLHNHARLWLASYMVHYRKVHWRVGADWMIAHLIDGDCASNHLSWQWVAGIGTGKPYLFNADNVARHARPDWFSAGTSIDAPYDHLDALARRPQALPAGEGPPTIDPPLLHAVPAPQLGFSPPSPEAVAGRDVWLLHPWALRPPPADLPADTCVVGLCLQEHHRHWPWTAARWRFVAEAMAPLTRERWYGPATAVATALRSARSVQTVADAHLGPRLESLAACRPAPRLFAAVDQPCASFSQWWAKVTRGVQDLRHLPGLAAAAEFRAR